MKTRYWMAFALAVSLFSLSAFADPDSDSCGLGWQITKKKSFLATTTRGTTNSFVPPTFGMSTGTIGCAQHSIVKKEEPAFRFLLANHQALELEMAMGHGEALAAFASEWGCSPASIGRFSRATQERFDRIFDAPRSNGVEVFERIRSVIREDQALRQDCSALRS